MPCIINNIIPAKNDTLIKIHIHFNGFYSMFKCTENTRGRHFEKAAETGQFRKALELFSTANTYMTSCLSSQLSMNSIRESLITINAEQFTDLKLNSKTLNLHVYVKWVIQ